MLQMLSVPLNILQMIFKYFVLFVQYQCRSFHKPLVLKHLGKQFLCKPIPRSRRQITWGRIFEGNCPRKQNSKFDAHEKERWSFRSFPSGVGLSVPMQSFTCGAMRIYPILSLAVIARCRGGVAFEN